MSILCDISDFENYIFTDFYGEYGEAGKKYNLLLDKEITDEIGFYLVKKEYWEGVLIKYIAEMLESKTMSNYERELAIKSSRDDLKRLLKYDDEFIFLVETSYKIRNNIKDDFLIKSECDENESIHHKNMFDETLRRTIEVIQQIELKKTEEQDDEYSVNRRRK